MMIQPAGKDAAAEASEILNFENFPCGGLAETQRQMQDALSCPNCRSSNLLPVSDCGTPPVLAIACEDCGEIEGDAPTLSQAVANWNRITRA
jgi:hypothetical protein